MRTCRLAPLLATAVLIAWSGAATAATVPSPSPPPAPSSSSHGRHSSRVSYVAGGSVYLDAGQSNGLAVGDSVDVMRDDNRIARLRVSFVSSRRASCDTVWTRRPVAVDDVAWYRPDIRRQSAVADSLSDVATRGDSLRAAAVLPTPKRRATVSGTRWRGRVGARWLSVQNDGGNRYQQPGLELRLDGRQAMGGHLDASLDVRGRRTVQSGANGTLTQQFSRVYRASITIRDHDNRRRLTLGRQTSPTLASISLFDGALLEWGTDRRTLGAFTGTQPDPVRFRWSAELLEGGMFAEWHQAPLALRRWSVSTGGVTSRRGREVNRDFLFAQGWWFSKGGSASLAQEVDVNRGWKRSAGEPALSWTSTFATVRVPVTPQVALQSGYDNRRNVRLWRDRETPETQFDDSYRQGAWAGATLQLFQHARSSAEVRTGSGGDRSDTWSLNGELYQLGRLQGSTRARYSSFSSPGNTSRLLSLGTGFDPLPQSHVEFTVGTRSTRDVLSGIEETERWQGVDVDLALGGRWYASGGYERQQGLAGGTRQVQAGLSVRL